MKDFLIAFITFCFSLILGLLIIPDIVKESMEHGYFEGQKDVIQGDIRLDIHNCEWIKNPWNDSIPIRKLEKWMCN